MPILQPGGRGSQTAWLLFGLKGRISRRIYWLSLVLLISINGVLVGQLFGGEEASFNRLAQAVGPFVILGTLYSNIAITVKRLHDVGYAGFLAVAIFVPLINFAFTIWVGVLPGTPGPNAYGEAPDARPA